MRMTCSMFMAASLLAASVTSVSAAPADIPDWVVFPGKEWKSLTPEQAGLDTQKFCAWLKSQEPRFKKAYAGQKPASGGIVLARGGCILHTWGDPDFKYQSASLGKTFTRMVLQLAVDKGLIKSPTDFVKDYWTGRGQLAPHKVMTMGYNAEVRFLDLQNMTAGFPVSNGWFWQTRDAAGMIGPKTIPSWAKFTGDPDYDNYAHISPGTTLRYSSGGYWRLSQALTAVWKKDLKDVLDEYIMGKIGIPPERWDWWRYGDEIRGDRNFYRQMPDYGAYIDPPYEIDGVRVRGGPGWVVMSAKDFARVGLLIATQGIWKQEHLISKLGGNTGVAANTVDGWGVIDGKQGYFSFGKVATDFQDPKPDVVASWILSSPKMKLTAREQDDRAYEVAVPMRDGIKLTTKVWFSGGKDQRKPVVLSRAYSASVDGRSRFNAAGYHCVGQATRGGGGADGSRFVYDAQDGYDCIDWISRQPWCDGNVVMYGKSYWGMTQLLAAIERHPALKAIVPQNIGVGDWESGYRCYGAVALAMTAHGRAGNRTDLAFYKSLPLIDLDLIGKGQEDPLWNAYVGAEHFDSYWDKISMRLDGVDGKIDRIKIPVFLHAGWYDYYAGVELKLYEYLKRNVRATDEIRIAVSPTDHLDRLPGGRSFPGGDKDEVGRAIRWFDHVVLGKDNGMDREPTVTVYVMGKNEWRGYDDWPPPNTRFTRFYFGAPSGSQSGTLTTTLPDKEGAMTYIYDPNDPVMCKGGSHSWCWQDNPYAPVGSYDQSSQEARHDVLVFKTPPLARNTEVSGPIKAKLYASSDCRDTDFVGVLLDILPDGRAYNLTEGILRMRFRESQLDPPKLMTSGNIYEVEIDLRATSNMFLAGHRIGLYMTSSYFALWDRNLNTGDPISTATRMKIARNTVYHGGEHPSHIILPIVRDEPTNMSMSDGPSPNP